MDRRRRSWLRGRSEDVGHPTESSRTEVTAVRPCGGNRAAHRLVEAERVSVPVGVVHGERGISLEARLDERVRDLRRRDGPGRQPASARRARAAGAQPLPQSRGIPRGSTSRAWPSGQRSIPRPRHARTTPNVHGIGQPSDLVACAEDTRRLHAAGVVWSVERKTRSEPCLETPVECVDRGPGIRAPGRLRFEPERVGRQPDPRRVVTVSGRRRGGHRVERAAGRRETRRPPRTMPPPSSAAGIAGLFSTYCTGILDADFPLARPIGVGAWQLDPTLTAKSGTAFLVGS